MKNKKIMVISLSSPCKMEKIYKSKLFAEQFGFEVVLGRNIALKKNYLAGSDEERAEDFEKALSDKSVDIVWFSRGGYGSMRILEKLDKIKVNGEKTIIGYSDATAIFFWALKRNELKLLYGPSFSELFNEKEYNKKSLINSIYEKKFKIKCSGESFKKEIKIVGGCLSIVVSLLGTKYFPEVNGKFLFLEDVNEPMYKLDRMITQLKLCGVFEKVEGLILGSLSRINGGDYKTFLKVVKEATGEKKPILFNRKIGHCKRKITLPLNFKANWDKDNLCFFY